VSAAHYPRVEPKSLSAWRRWLRENHVSARGVWLVSKRRGSGTPAVEYAAAVEEALCYGWIDGQYRPLDVTKAALLFAPRRKGSLWARSNRERVRVLIAAGRMRPAGRAKIEAAKRDGTFMLLEGAENGVVPPDLRKALAAGGVARKFASLSKTAKRAHLVTLLTAKRPETRAKRVVAIVRALRS
jgi:uncharacterized protein YdeI (YjbR/CyaY-like superfamily)